MSQRITNVLLFVAVIASCCSILFQQATISNLNEALRYKQCTVDALRGEITDQCTDVPVSVGIFDYPSSGLVVEGSDSGSVWMPFSSIAWPKNWRWIRVRDMQTGISVSQDLRWKAVYSK
jgi:hypothetical protein